jgi:hypothetical protein
VLLARKGWNEVEPDGSEMSETTTIERCLLETTFLKRLWHLGSGTSDRHLGPGGVGKGRGEWGQSLTYDIWESL